jgi:predicted transposase YbfD/YdcC
LHQVTEQTQPLSSTQTEERSRGRLERRQVHIFLPSPVIPLPKKWENVQRIICVQRQVEHKNEITDTTHYYMSSIEDDRAVFFANGIRGHWSIENRLHYVKDVNLHEDTSGIKNPDAASNLSLLRNIAINIIRQNDFESIKDGAIFFISNVKKLLKIIAVG